MVLDDMQLVSDMNLDSYRFSVSWSRIEPERDVISEEGLAHYDAQLDALKAASIQPMITVHHFSNPLWTNNFLEGCPEGGPTDTNLCGWADPEGSQLIIEEIAEHGALLAQRYGDRVDDWCTINEPVNYLLASYGLGVFPPGESNLFTDLPRLTDSMRHLLSAQRPPCTMRSKQTTLWTPTEMVSPHRWASHSLLPLGPQRGMDKLVRIQRTPLPHSGCDTSTTSSFPPRSSTAALTPILTRSRKNPIQNGRADSIGSACNTTFVPV